MVSIRCTNKWILWILLIVLFSGCILSMGLSFKVQAAETGEFFTGQYLYFASYNDERLKWQIMNVDVENKNITLLLDDVLLDTNNEPITMHYSDSDESDWENSKTCQWLNGEEFVYGFYNDKKNFTEIEIESILPYSDEDGFDQKIVLPSFTELGGQNGSVYETGEGVKWITMPVSNPGDSEGLSARSVPSNTQYQTRSIYPEPVLGTLDGFWIVDNPGGLYNTSLNNNEYAIRPVCKIDTSKMFIISGYGTNHDPYEIGFVGQSLEFGRFQGEPVLWWIMDMDKEDNTITIMTEKAYEDGLPFNKEFQNTSWMLSDICRWLNQNEDGFLNGSGGDPQISNFTVNEKDIIIPYNNSAPAYSQKIVLPSYTELGGDQGGFGGFLPNYGEGETWSIMNSINSNSNSPVRVSANNEAYWTRSVGNDSGYTNSTWLVSMYGGLNLRSVNNEGISARPVCKIDLQYAYFKGGSGLYEDPYELTSVLSITTESLPAGKVGELYDETLSARGGAKPYTWSAQGLPAGLEINTVTGTVYGKPEDAGAFNIDFTVSDDSENSSSAAIELIIVEAAEELLITTGNLPSGKVGKLYDETLSASGGVKPYTWSAQGLPAGLDINTVTGAVYGKPEDAGNFNVEFTVSDDSNNSSNATMELIIEEAAEELLITTENLPAGKVGQSYNETLSAIGGVEPYTWSAQGLPAGIDMNTVTGTVYGQPENTGTFKVKFTVADSNEETNSTEIDLIIRSSESVGSSSSGGNSYTVDWNKVKRELENSKDEETVTVKMKGKTKIPADVLESYDGRNVNLVLDLGNGITWTINGRNIKAESISSSIYDLGAEFINVKSISSIAENEDIFQIELEHHGQFPFAGILNVPVGDKNDGRTLYLSYYNDKDNCLEYKCSSEVDNTGYAHFVFSRASKYVATEKIIKGTIVRENLSENNSTLVPAFTKDGVEHIVALSAFINQIMHFTAPETEVYIYKENCKSFTDITDHWASEDISFVASRKLFDGVGGEKFAPDTSMTRGMFVTVLGRLISLDIENYKKSRFIDIKDSDYCAPYAAWAFENNIVEGTLKGKFQPNKDITREEMAVMINRFIEYVGFDIDEKNNSNSVFNDENRISIWAKDAINKLANANIIGGKPGKIFDPSSNASRAEVAAIFKRLIIFIVKK